MSQKSCIGPRRIGCGSLSAFYFLIHFADSILPSTADEGIPRQFIANHLTSSPEWWPSTGNELPSGGLALSPDGLKTQQAPSLSGSATYTWSRLFATGAISFFFIWSALSNKVDPKMVIICWMLSSIAMNIVNKEVAISFKATSFAIFFQMLFAVCMFTIVEWKNLRCGRRTDLLKWSVVPFFFAGMLFTSIKSLQEMSLSGVLIIRNVLPLLTFGVEKLLYNKPAKITFTMVVSMAVALFGTIMYGFWNLTVTHTGICYVLANCGLTVVDRILQRHFLQDPNFTVSLPLCMVWNNLIGAVLICALAFGNGEIFMWSSLVHKASATAWIVMLFACFCGCAIGYLGLKCQKMVSATTFLMLQNFAKIVVIMVGMAYFGDHMWGASAAGCALSMCGAMWYGFERLPAETAETCKSEKLDKMDKLRRFATGDPMAARRAEP